MRNVKPRNRTQQLPTPRHAGTFRPNTTAPIQPRYTRQPARTKQPQARFTRRGAGSR
jgi:hypothetical protein